MIYGYWPYAPGFEFDTEPSIPAAPPVPEPPLPRLIFCAHRVCGCTYVGRCPVHTPEEGGYEP